MERLAIHGATCGFGAAALPLLIGLASALAGRSLEQAVATVLAALEAADLPLARQRLSWIVGRDTDGLESSEILRAAAETASENAVDGLFAPLFWMLVGAGLWSLGALAWPGPLAWAWAFKAASTLDSMLGYRQGRLRWLGTAGARLDDLLVWLPCRLVALSLPLVAGAQPAQAWQQLQQARMDGRSDPSPNAGLSQAAYAQRCRRAGDAAPQRPPAAALAGAGRGCCRCCCRCRRDAGRSALIRQALFSRRCSVGAAIHRQQDHTHGEDEDADVQPEGAMAHIGEVELHAVVVGDVVPA